MRAQSVPWYRKWRKTSVVIWPLTRKKQKTQGCFINASYGHMFNPHWGFLRWLTWWILVRTACRSSVSTAAPPSDRSRWRSAARTAASTAPAPPPPRRPEPGRTLTARRCICIKHTADERTRLWHTHNANTTHLPYLCMKTVFMPRLRAMAQACCPPAPPKHANTCREVSWPLACEGGGRWGLSEREIQKKNMNI